MPDSPITSPVSGFSHVQLLCTDVARSRDWYSTVLDADVLTESDDGTYVALRHKPSRIVIVLSERPADTPATGPLDHLAFAVPDGDALAAWGAHLADAGIEHDGIVDELGKPSLQLLDPDGINIELVAPPPRS
jgi:glyoxylase I family protein